MEVSEEAKEVILAAQVNAPMQGHDIEPFQPVGDCVCGFEAKCRPYQKTVLVGDSGLKGPVHTTVYLSGKKFFDAAASAL